MSGAKSAWEEFMRTHNRTEKNSQHGEQQGTGGASFGNASEAWKNYMENHTPPEKPSISPVEQIGKPPAAQPEATKERDTREHSYAESAGITQPMGSQYGAAASAPDMEKPGAAAKVSGKETAARAIGGFGKEQKPLTEAQAIQQMARDSDRAYYDYINSAEYKAAVEAKRQKDIESGRSGGYAASAGMLPQNNGATPASAYAASAGITNHNEENAALDEIINRAALLKNEADYWQDELTRTQDLESYSAWSDEDKALLQRYISGRLGSDETLFTDIWQLSPMGGGIPGALIRGGQLISAEDAARKLSQKYGREAVDDMAETVKRHQNAQRAEEVAAGAQRHSEGFVGGTAASIGAVGASTMGSITAPIGVASDLLTRTGRYKTLDPYQAGNLPNIYAGAVKENVSRQIAGEGEDSNLFRKGAALLYQGGMSAAENIARVAAGGKFGSLAMAAAGSFGQTVQQASEQGATPEQAIVLGVVNAGIEAATEKIPLDNLFNAAKAANPMQALKQVLIQGGIEATTEEISLFGTLLTEAAILREKSSYQKTIQEQMAQGKSYEEAKHFADMQILKEAGETAAVSFISGGLMEGGNQLTNYTGRVTPESLAEYLVTANREETRDKPLTPEQTAAGMQETFRQAMGMNEVDNQQSDEVPSHAINQSPTYEELVQKDDLPVIDVGTNSSGKPYAQLKTEAMQKATNEKWFDEPHTNADTGMRIFLTNKTFTHAFSNLRSDFGTDTILAMNHLPELIHDAVLTNVADPKNPNKPETKVYTFLAAISGENGVEPVKLTVKEYSSTSDSALPKNILDYFRRNKPEKVNNRLYDIKALEVVGIESAETEKEFGASAIVASGQGPDANSTPNSTISIANLLELVKGKTEKYIPQQVRKPAPTFDGNGNGQTVDNKLYNEDGTAFESVGAAEKGFSDKETYYDLLTDDNVKPSREGDVRQMEIPEKDAYGRRVTDFAANAAGAAVTTDEMADTIAELIGDGALGFDTRTHQQSLENAARRIKDKGSYAARESITKAVMNGKVQDGDIETAMLLYAREAKRGNAANASELIVDLATMANMTGRNLNLFKLLRKMTPEGQLMAVQKDITRNLEKINKGREAQKQVGQEDGKQIADAGNEAKKDVVKQLDAATGAVSVNGGKVQVNKSPKSQPFWFEYAQKVGEALAKSVLPKESKTRTTMEIITSQLRRFASEKAPDREKKAGISASDLLRDYVQNQEFYDSAWKVAQDELREHIRQRSDAAKSGQEMVDSGELEKLAQAAIMVNEKIGVDATARERNKLFVRAIVESAIATDEKVSTLQTQAALGFTNMSQSIADHLIRKTGATGEMENTIRAAVEDYVRKQTSDATQNDRILQNTIQKAMSDIKKTLAETAKSSHTQKTNTKQQIIDMLVRKYGIGKSDASNVASVVGEYFGEMTKQKAQEILQQKFADRKKPIPKGLMERFEEYANLGAFDIGSRFNQAAARKLFGEKAGEIPAELGKAFLDAKTDSEKEQALEDIYKDIAAKIKPTLGEAWDAWRNFSMLANFKTHERNFVATAAFRPYAAVKRGIGAIIEHYALDQENRTKAILGVGKNSRELLKWAKQDAKSKAVQDMMDYSGTTGDNARSEIEKYRKYLPGIADTARKANLKAMEWEDMVWKKREYSLSLASFLKARGYTAEQAANGTIPEGVLQEARAHSVQEAKKATFNDRNQFSDAIAKLRIKDNKPWSRTLNVVLKGIVPFTRTPANVLKRFTEYSLAGIASGIYKLAKDVKTGEATVAEGIDRIASGLTGTGAMVLGAALAAGLIPGIRLIGALDEEEELEGAQEYSIQIGDQYFSIAWLAPANIPLFIGANLYSSISGKAGDGDLDGWDVLFALAETASDALDPMLELSMLSSLNDTIKAVEYEESAGDKLLALVANAATSYFTQGLPTILGQIEQSTEETKSSVYSNTDNPVQRAFEKTVGRATQKIPGIDLYQTEKVDEWGRAVENADTWIERVLNAFFNPFTVSEQESTPVTQEILRLNGVQDENLLPKTAAKTLTYTDKDGKRHENYRLTAEEYSELATVQGKTAARILDQLVKSKDYQKLTDTQKAKAIQLAYEYAREKGRTEAVKGYDGLTGWRKGIGGKETAVIIQKALAADFAGSEKVFGEMTGAGVSSKTAYDIGKLMDSLKPQDGYKTVRDIQQAEAIAGANLTERDTIAALKAYGSDAQDEKLDAMLDEGFSASQYVAAWGIYSEEKEEGGRGTKDRTIQAFMDEFDVDWETAAAIYDIYG